MTAVPPPVEVLATGTFDVVEYDAELAAASANHAIGTSCWFANGVVRVWEVRLEPGQRGPFHIHDGRYFWTCVEPGQARQRYGDGTWKDLAYGVGTTMYFAHTPEAAVIHDLENIGDTTLRFVTVELLDGDGEGVGR